MHARRWHEAKPKAEANVGDESDGAAPDVAPRNFETARSE